MRREDVPVVALPVLPPWARNVLIAILALYAVELFAANVLQLPVSALMWWPARSGSFLPFQPLTRWLVQGNDVINVVLWAVGLYFFLPPLSTLLNRRQAIEVAGAVVVGGTVLPLLLDMIGVIRPTPGSGWGPAVTACLVLFGLSMPNAVIRLFFVLPVPAGIFVWGTGVITGLLLLALLTIGAADHFGTFLGVLAWWNLRGPGARRRKLKQKGARIERELRKFQVLPGGRGDDDVVH